MMEVTIRLISATCFIQLDMAACSVSVRVSWSELAEISSIALSTRSAWFTSFTRVTYQPTWPWFQGVVSSKYFQFSRNIWSHQPAVFLSDDMDDADDLEGPVLAAVLVREDRGLHGHLVADLPAELARQAFTRRARRPWFRQSLAVLGRRPPFRIDVQVVGRDGKLKTWFSGFW
jgi:hypothetical protein